MVPANIQVSWRLQFCWKLILTRNRPLIRSCNAMTRSSHSETVFKMGVLKNFAISIGKHLHWSFFFKKRLHHSCFPVNIHILAASEWSQAKCSIKTFSTVLINPLSSNPTKKVNHTQTTRRLLQTNCLCVFDHFVGLTFEGLNTYHQCTTKWTKQFWLITLPTSIRLLSSGKGILLPYVNICLQKLTKRKNYTLAKSIFKK